jgi:hypothetical protein
MPVIVRSAFILLSLCISQTTIGLLLSKSASLLRSRGFQLDNNQISRKSQRLYLDLRFEISCDHKCTGLYFSPGDYFILTEANLFFFPSDILDDDSTEFLEALKRQMEGTNILNASPREVLNNKEKTSM